MSNTSYIANVTCKENWFIGSTNTYSGSPISDTDSPFESLTEELVKSFDKIEKSASFLSDTVNNFRNFYRQDNKIKVFK